MNDPVLFDDSSAERIARAVKIVERQYGETAANPLSRQSHDVMMAKVTNGTPDGDGNYAAVPTTYSAIDAAWTEYEAIKLKPSNAETLTLNVRYPALPSGITAGGSDLWITVSAWIPAAGGGTIVLQEDHLTYGTIDTLDVLSENGLFLDAYVGQPAGTGALNVQATDGSNNGVITGDADYVASQMIAAGKIFKGDLYVSYNAYASYPDHFDAGNLFLDGNWPQATQVRNCWIRFLVDDSPLLATDFYAHTQGSAIENYGDQYWTVLNLHEDDETLSWTSYELNGDPRTTACIAAFSFGVYTAPGTLVTGMTGSIP